MILSACYIIFILTVTTMLYPVSAHNGGNVCGVLYSEPKAKGTKLVLRDDEDFDKISSLRKWTSTKSAIVEKYCTLQICSEAFLTGDCQTFGHGSHSVTMDRTRSFECLCSKRHKCSCDSIPFKQATYARAYLTGNCETCDAEYFELTSESTYIPPGFVDYVQSVVVRKGCEVTIYTEPELKGFESVLDQGTFEFQHDVIASYECSCKYATDETIDKSSRPKHYPELIEVPSSFQKTFVMLHEGKYGTHPGLLAALHTYSKGRSHKNAYILLLGSSGTGKSSTVNLLFDNPNITRVGDTSSVTDKIHEFHIPAAIDEFGISNSELRVVDTPGLGDTRGVEHDAQFLASLDKYLSSHEELNDRLPNVVLIVHKFDDNRFSGVGSNFVKMLRGLDSFRGRITDENYSNVIFVLTHFCSVSKAIQRKPDERIEQFRKTIQDFSLFPKPVHIVVAENMGLDCELPLVTGYTKLPNNELYPHNLFTKLELVTSNVEDVIGKGVFRTVFRDSALAKNIQTDFSLIGQDLEKVSMYLDVLNSANLQVDQTEISLLLDGTWETAVPLPLRLQYSTSLAYLKKALSLRRINKITDIPKTSAGIMQLLLEIKQDDATRMLLETGLSLKVPNFPEKVIAGYSYNLFEDETLSKSPLKLGTVDQSDIGFLIPNVLTCTVQTRRSDIFVMVNAKDEYIRQRLKDVQISGSIPSEKFTDDVKPGYNIRNGKDKSCTLSAVREFKLFEFTLNENFEFTEDFRSVVKNLLPFDENDYGSVEEWTGFFHKFGTHVVQSVSVGGSIEVRLSSQRHCRREDMKNLLSILSIVDDNSVFGLLSGEEGLIMPEEIPHSLSFRGGDYNFFVNDLTSIPINDLHVSLREWKKSLKLHPTVLTSTMKLVPLAQLVTRRGEQYAAEIERATSLFFKAKLRYVPANDPQHNSPQPRERTPIMKRYDWADWVLDIGEKIVRIILRNFKFW